MGGKENIVVDNNDSNKEFLESIFVWADSTDFTRVGVLHYVVVTLVASLM